MNIRAYLVAAAQVLDSARNNSPMGGHTERNTPLDLARFGRID
jgi:hypothetical protein